jgi:acyl phosphate:glycerol-3-phosphate acyltransferase
VGSGMSAVVSSRRVGTLDLRVPRLAPGRRPHATGPYDRLVVLATAPSAGVAIACVAAAYLVGTFPTAQVVAGRRGIDPTRSGSGNPGATNVARTAGRRAGAATLVGDLLKGALAAGVGWAVGGHALGVACGVAAVVGHVLPVTRRFRGGKGVATGAGMALVLFPLAFAVAVVAFAVVVAATRTVSLASIVAVLVLPAAAWAFGAPGGEVAALAVSAVLVVVAHRGNIVRLAHGEERRIGA